MGHLLRGWQAKFPEAEDNVLSNAADDRLVEKAKEYDCPLVSNEVNPKKRIRKRALTAGVSVYTPEEFFAKFFAPTMNDVALVEGFFGKFGTETPAFLDQKPAVVRHNLQDMATFLRWVLE